MELVKQRTFSPGQIYVTLSQSTLLSKLNIISNFDPKIVQPNHLALNHYEYLRKENNIFTTTVLQKKSFVALLNVRRMFTNVSNFMRDSKLIDVPLVCLAETQYHRQLFLDMYPLHMKLLQVIVNCYKLLRVR